MNGQGELFGGPVPNVKGTKTFLLGGPVDDELRKLGVIDRGALRAESDKRTREAIRRVDENAAERWKREADEVIHILAAERDTFTADDVWWGLEARNADAPHEPRALGARMQAAAKSGLIVNTRQVVKSLRPETHGSWVALWASKERVGS